MVGIGSSDPVVEQRGELWGDLNRQRLVDCVT